MAHIFNFVFLFYVANYVLCPLFTPSPCLWLLPVDKGGHKARFLPTCFFSMIFVLPTNELSFFLRPFWHSSKSFMRNRRAFPGIRGNLVSISAFGPCFFFFSKKSIIRRRWYIVKRFGVLILVGGRKVSDLFCASWIGDRKRTWSLGSIDHDHWPNEIGRDESELPEVLHLLYYDANVSIQYHYSVLQFHIQDKPDACIFLPQARRRRMPWWHQLDRRGALETMSRTM